jgi:hypothetical protein
MTETTKQAIRDNVVAIKDGDHKVRDRNILIKELRKHGGLIFRLLQKSDMLKELPTESLEFWLNQIEKERR